MTPDKGTQAKGGTPQACIASLAAIAATVENVSPLPPPEPPALLLPLLSLLAACNEEAAEATARPPDAPPLLLLLLLDDGGWGFLPLLLPLPVALWLLVLVAAVVGVDVGVVARWAMWGGPAGKSNAWGRTIELARTVLSRLKALKQDRMWSSKGK
jgi:hypothetical protein